MARPKYKITKSDFDYAYKYIERNFDKIAITQDFHAIKRNRDPDKLTILCELNFNGKDWDRLKSTIRVERKKDKSFYQDKTIKIKNKSFEELTALKNKLEDYLYGSHSKRHKFTYSEIIEKTCEYFNDRLKIDVFEQLGFNIEEVTGTKSEPKQKSTKLKLWLRVENNNKFVRGKGKTRQHIEDYYLSKFDANKIEKDGWNYELIFKYEDDQDLNDQIDQLISSMNDEADIRNGFIEYDLYEEGTDRSW